MLEREDAFAVVRIADNRKTCIEQLVRPFGPSAIVAISDFAFRIKNVGPPATLDALFAIPDAVVTEIALKPVVLAEDDLFDERAHLAHAREPPELIVRSTLA